MQSRKMSFVEASLNVMVGYFVSLVLTFAVLPIFDLRPSISEGLAITVIFTAASLVRSYFLRRLFVSLR